MFLLFKTSAQSEGSLERLSDTDHEEDEEEVLYQNFVIKIYSCKSKYFP